MQVRKLPRVFATASIVSMMAADGCSSGTATSPSCVMGPGPTYTIAGTITEYRGGPLAGLELVAFDSGGCGQTKGFTDAQGRYSLASPSSRPVLLQFGKQGYTYGFKSNVSVDNSVQNFVLDRYFAPSFWLDSNAVTFTGTIWGDELLPGDDLSFGGVCERTACRLLDMSNGPKQQVEITLRWKNPANHLALYVSQQPYWEDLPPPPPVAAERYCCSPDLVAVVPVEPYGTGGGLVAIVFEQARGATPAANDNETFELIVRPLR